MTISLPDIDDRPFYEAVLREVGAPLSTNNLTSLYAWRQAEGGSATYNPFNTTWKLPGSVLYGSNTHGVQSYATPQDGVTATVKTLTNGKYEGILSALRSDAAPETTVAAIMASRWGTTSLIQSVLAMYARGKVVVNPIATVPGAPTIATLRPVLIFLPFVPAPTKETASYWWLAGIAALSVTGAIIWRVRRGR